MSDQLVVQVKGGPGERPSLTVTRKSQGYRETVGLTMEDARAIFSRGERPDSIANLMTEAEFRGFEPELAEACDEWFQRLGDDEG